MLIIGHHPNNKVHALNNELFLQVLNQWLCQGHLPREPLPREAGKFKRVHNNDVATIVVRMLARNKTALINKSADWKPPN